MRIVTIHKSKGLEFPVVFLPFAWSRAAVAPIRPIAYHVDGAAVLDLAPDRRGRRPVWPPRHAETVRAMYVALTRAEQRCYVFWGAAAARSSRRWRGCSTASTPSRRRTGDAG